MDEKHEPPRDAYGRREAVNYEDLPDILTPRRRRFVEDQADDVARLWRDEGGEAA